MSVKCQVIMDAMDRLAPRYLAESWDNVGLLLGSPAQKVNKVLVTLDVTQKVADQAVRDGIDLIVTHHPVIFTPVKQIRADLPQGQLLTTLIKGNIAVYAAHTNLDSATGGVNDILAAKFKLQDAKPLAVSYAEKLYKLIVFTPKTHVEAVRQAMSEAGAGHIGNYSHCSFAAAGTGTFMPLEHSNPFIGQKNTLEYVEEVRLETIVTEKGHRRIIKEMLKAHPYEEVAYDLFSLVNSGNALGLGRIGKLESPMSLHEFAALIKSTLNIEYVSVAGSQDQMIKKVAVCGGSGASFVQKAAFAGADVLVTGDVKYHEAQDALAAGMAVIDAGHFATEQPVVPYVADYLAVCNHNDKWNVEIAVDTVNQDVLAVW